MGFSVSAQQGIKQNGKRWKGHLRGLPDINDELEALIQARPADAKEKIEACLRRIHALFSPYFTDDNCTSGEREALEWFEEESPGYELENDLMGEWVENFDHYLGELYDFADFNRIWVVPRGMTK